MTEVNWFVLGIVFEVVGLCFLYLRSERKYLIDLIYPMSVKFSQILEQKKTTGLGQDILRPEVRGQYFNDDCFVQTLQAYGLRKSPFPMQWQKDIMDMGYLRMRAPEIWGPALERNEQNVLAREAIQMQKLELSGYILIFLGFVSQFIGYILT